MATTVPVVDVKCRICDSPLKHLLVNLGMSPLCENLVYEDEIHKPETFYPLRAYVCDQCWLVQLPAHVGGEEIFGERYAYASSVSSSWLKHCEVYTEQIVDRLGLDERSLIVEVACNDGYLLKNFVKRGIPCLGIEPATRMAEVAKGLGIPICTKYFGRVLAEQLANEGVIADLIIGNNVLAHVPDIHDFLSGFKRILSPQGTVTFEFPHLLELIQHNQFDTIYQEHYSYLSLAALKQAFAMNGLRIYDVEHLSTHGGSLRVYGCHEEAIIVTQPAVALAMAGEEEAGLMRLETYQSFAAAVSETKWKLLEFLINAKRCEKVVVGYGAPGKGNTLLNYCGIREDLLKFTVDKNPMKQGSYLVGSQIPVYEPSAIDRERPDYILILPWNLRDEIVSQLAHVRQWGAKFVFAIPNLEVM